MSWKITLFGIAVTAMVCTGEEDVLTITTLRGSTTGTNKEPIKHITVCYTAEGSKTYKQPATLVAESTDPGEGQVLQVESVVDPVEGCFIFDKADITTLATKHLNLILKTTKSTGVGKKDGLGIADVTFPVANEYPQDIKVDVIGSSGPTKSIRIKDTLASGLVLKIDGADNTCPITFGPPCYFMDIPTPTKFDVCNPNIGDAVALCANVESNTVNIKVVGIKAFTLSHDASTISIETDTTVVQAPAEEADIVIQKTSDKAIMGICKLTTLSGDCGLTLKDSEEYSIFVAYKKKTDGDLISFEDSKLVKNRNLKGEKLTAGVTDILEASWVKDTSPNQDYYQLSRVPTDDGGFTTADADCSHMSSLCYVYFTGLTVPSYTLTLGVIDTWIDGPMTPGLDKEIAVADMAYVSEEALTLHMEDIDVEDIQVRQEFSEKNIQFCFKCNKSNQNKTSQYEIILINKKGNWKKTQMKTGLSDDDDCSTEINFPREQLNDDSELNMLVVARDINTGKVLSSSGKKQDITAPRMIKPDEGNGSGTLAIVGAAIGGVACLMALVAAVTLVVMKRKRSNDGLQYPLQRTNVEDSNIIYGLDNPNSTT